MPGTLVNEVPVPDNRSTGTTSTSYYPRYCMNNSTVPVNYLEQPITPTWDWLNLQLNVRIGPQNEYIRSYRNRLLLILWKLH